MSHALFSRQEYIRFRNVAALYEEHFKTPDRPFPLVSLQPFRETQSGSSSLVRVNFNFAVILVTSRKNALGNRYTDHAIPVIIPFLVSFTSIRSIVL